MRRISVFIADPQYVQLRALARQRDQPAAELLRQAVHEYLERQGTEAAPSKRTARPRVATRKRA